MLRTKNNCIKFKQTFAYLCGTYTSVAIDSLAHSQSVFLERFTLKPEKS